jgi:hypothetical protein
MGQFNHQKLLLSAAAISAVLFSAILICGTLFLNGCAHTVDYQIQHDTDTVIHHDTIPGPAFLRFLSVLNNGMVSPIITVTTRNGDAFANVDKFMTNQFFPIPHDSTFYLLASYFTDVTNKKNDSIPIPSLKPYSMTTIALFKSNEPIDPNRLSPVFADDSLRKNLAPGGSCYVRLVNGLQDYPQPFATVNMHLDDIHAAPLFKNNVSYKEIGNYILIPEGNHQIFLRSETDITQSYTITQQFISGQFYTIKLTGKHADQSDQISVDAE